MLKVTALAALLGVRSVIAQVGTNDFAWDALLAELGVTGVVVAVLIWVYRDVTSSLRSDLDQARKELAESTAKTQEMNKTLMSTVAPAMSEMTHASRQLMELMVRRGERE